MAWEAIEYFGLNEGGLDVARLVGFVVLSMLVIGLLLTWTWRFRREFWHRNNVLLLLSLLLLFSVFALKLTAGRDILPYALPLAAVGMLVTVLLDAGVAMVITALIAILAAAVNGAGLELAAYTMLGGIAGIVGVRRGDRLACSSRPASACSWCRRAIVLVFALLGDQDITGIVQLLGAAAVSAGGATVAAAGSFAVIGSLFGIVTVFQLLELANPSQPLLRRLLVETPGTYHHSLMVGNLAERAAEAIGGDALLARVAAYYHDIGKLSNPVAFIENQAGGDNIHDELDPETSAQLLKSHVSAGIDIAYKSGLPKAIIAFIPQHHGTAVMSYFYARAREQAAAPYGGLETAEGSKAADAVDVREVPPWRPEAPVARGRDHHARRLAWRRPSGRCRRATRRRSGRWWRGSSRSGSRDDQFDECDLTLRDIELIREAFVEQLLGMYHQRVAYPQNKVVELRAGARRAATGSGPPPAGPVADRRRAPGRRPAAGARRTRPRAVGRRRRSRPPARPGRPRSGLILADDAELASLNAEHMGKDGPTDVLSFPLLPPEAFPRHPGKAAGHGPAGAPFALPPGDAPHLGDVVVSVERAIDQAEAGPRRPDGRRPLGCPRRAPAPGDPRHAPCLRLGPRRARGGGGDAGPRAGAARGLTARTEGEPCTHDDLDRGIGRGDPRVRARGVRGASIARAGCPTEPAASDPVAAASAPATGDRRLRGRPPSSPALHLRGVPVPGRAHRGHA